MGGYVVAPLCGCFITTGVLVMVILLRINGLPLFSSAVVMFAVLAGLWLSCLLQIEGLLLSSCTLSVSVQDLGCHLQWNCPDVNSTVFTVQTKAQGEEWQNVSNCVQLSISSCDASLGITDFDVYNYIRVGVSPSPGNLQWTKSVSCDPLKDPNRRFSPPSCSLSLEARRLQVEVAFPCAPATACWDEEHAPTCCPVSDFLELNATVMLYNELNAADTQTRTNMVQRGEHFSVEFGWLTPGQEYCVVAAFASSPLSSPQCIHVPNPGGLNFQLLSLHHHGNLFMKLGLGGMICAFLLLAVCVWRISWGSSHNTLPKSLLSLQRLNQEDPFEHEARPVSLEEENFRVNHLSIISLSEMAVSEMLSGQSSSPSLGAGYYASPLLQQHDDPVDMEVDGSPESPQQSKPAHACTFPLGFPGVLLSSVRLAGAQGLEAELHHLPRLFLNLDGDHDTHT